MGLRWSKDATLTTTDSFEKALQEIDIQLSQHLLYLSSLKLNCDRVSRSFTIYSFVLWTILVSFSFSFPSSPSSRKYFRSESFPVFFDWIHHLDPWQVLVFRVAIFVLGPLGILLIRSMVQWRFERNRMSTIHVIESLRAQQIGKIEELKRITAFYRAKELIDRYQHLLADPFSLVPNETPNPSIPQITHSPATPNQPPQTPNRPLPLQSPTPSSPVIPATPSQPNSGTQSPGWISQWVEKMVVGDTTSNDPKQMYALICGMCHHHNGLATELDFPQMRFICRSCATLNDRRALGLNQPWLFRKVGHKTKRPASVPPIERQNNPIRTHRPSMDGHKNPINAQQPSMDLRKASVDVSKSLIDVQSVDPDTLPIDNTDGPLPRSPINPKPHTLSHDSMSEADPLVQTEDGVGSAEPTVSETSGDDHLSLSSCDVSSSNISDENTVVDENLPKREVSRTQSPIHLKLHLPKSRPTTPNAAH